MDLLTARIHDEILLELKNKNIDVYDRTSDLVFVKSAIDRHDKTSILENLQAKIACDGKLNQRKQTIQSKDLEAMNRYNSSYWRGWKEQSEILETISDSHLSTKNDSFTHTTYPKNARRRRQKYSENSYQFKNNVNAPSKLPKLPHDFTDVKYLYTVCAGNTLPQPNNKLADNLNAISGGVIATGPARQPPIPSVTCRCVFSSTEELDRQINIPRVVFPTATRFAPPQAAAPTPTPSSNPKITSDGLDTCGTRFCREQRFSTYDRESKSGPGPEHYNMTRLFDDKQVLTSERIEKALVLSKIPATGLKTYSCTELIGLSSFSFGCNAEEHVKFGICLDGKCCQRASWEQSAIRDNDTVRLTGDREGLADIERALRPVGGSPSDSQSTDAADSTTQDVLGSYSPMELAAYLGDVKSIMRLVGQGANINAVHQVSGGTSLHIIVSRKLTRPLRELVALSDRLKLQLDVRNRDGDTLLHIASRRGYQDVVEILCDAGADPRIPNFTGSLPASFSRTHSIYQILHISAQKKLLEEELCSVRNDIESTERRRIISLAAIRDGSRRRSSNTLTRRLSTQSKRSLASSSRGGIAGALDKRLSTDSIISSISTMILEEDLEDEKEENKSGNTHSDNSLNELAAERSSKLGSNSRNNINTSSINPLPPTVNVVKQTPPVVPDDDKYEDDVENSGSDEDDDRWDESPLSIPKYDYKDFYKNLSL